MPCGGGPCLGSLFGGIGPLCPIGGMLLGPGGALGFLGICPCIGCPGGGILLGSKPGGGGILLGS